MLISHEIPKTLFPIHDKINDYPYLLAHLLSSKYNYDGQYASFYKEKLQRVKYPVSYLDNSCYELGYPVDIDTLIEIANEYKPSHVVIPDCFGDANKTISLARQLSSRLFNKTRCSLFAVLQGNTIQERLKCYEVFSKMDEIDIIGVNFQPLKEGDREKFLQTLLEQNPVKKIHLLGMKSPYELMRYSKDVIDSIYSIDSSNPVMCGLKNYRYKDREDFDYTKPLGKLADNLDIEINLEQLSDIKFNCSMFRKFINR